MTANRILDELKSAVSKLSPTTGWNDVTLSSGIKAKIFIDGSGVIKTFHPVSGPGTFTAKEVLETLK